MMALLKRHPRISFLCLSLVAHMSLLYPLGVLGGYNYARPVNPPDAVMIELARLNREPAGATNPVGRNTAGEVAVKGKGPAEVTPAGEPEESLQGKEPQDPTTRHRVEEPVSSDDGKVEASGQHSE